MGQILRDYNFPQGPESSSVSEETLKGAKITVTDILEFIYINWVVGQKVGVFISIFRVHMIC